MRPYFGGAAMISVAPSSDGEDQQLITSEERIGERPIPGPLPARFDHDGATFAVFAGEHALFAEPAGVPALGGFVSVW